MKENIEDLESLGYQKIHELPHDQIIPFVKMALAYPTKASSAYKWVSRGSFFLLCALGSFLYFSNSMSFLNLFTYFGQAVLLCLLLIPIHEWIHMLAYKGCGAKHASMKAHWKRFYFLATADRFLTNRKELRYVAMAPLFIISGIFLVSIVAILFLSPLSLVAIWILSCLLVIHAQFCSGDFAMMSYMEHKNGDVILYDDEAEKCSYFYQKARA
jgi:hypothetical protein